MMVRFGVIGTNWITDAFIEAASQHDHFSLQAVYSRTEEKANDFANKHNIPYAFTSIEEFAKSNEFDAVYIASPNAMHAEQAVLLMKNGKHVLCEKSFASNCKEAEKMIEMAQKHKVLLMEAVKTTHLPNFKAIQHHLHKVGKVRRYFASYCQYSSRYDAYKEGKVLNAFDPQFSNGAIMDIGVYCMYPLITLFGEPKEIKASGVKLETGVDGQGSVQMEYDDMEALVIFSKITNSFIPSEIQGEKGSMLIDKIHTPEHVEIRYNDGTSENISQPQEHYSMYYEAKTFIECIQKNQTESEINTLNQSLKTVKTIEEARRQMGVVFPADQ